MEERRGHGSEDADAGGGDVRLDDVTVGGRRRAARGEAGHERDRGGRVAGTERCEGGGGTRGLGVGADRARRVAEVDRRDRVEVGVERSRRHVDEHHRDAARGLDRRGLVGAGHDAAVALHDLAGDLGRVERAGSAEPDVRSSRAGETGVDRGDERGLSGRVGRRDRGADERRAVAEDDLEVGAAEGARRDRGEPGARVVEGAGTGAAVPCRRGDEDAGARGAQEGELVGRDRVGLRGAADREVDDVDTVGDGVVDRGDDVLGEAAGVHAGLAGPADLVRRDLAAGAMPETVPKPTPSTVTPETTLPAAVEAVWLPWPSPSRGERYSSLAMFCLPKPST